MGKYGREVWWGSIVGKYGGEVRLVSMLGKYGYEVWLGQPLISVFITWYRSRWR